MSIIRKDTKHPKFVFFGTPLIAVKVLDKLENAGLLPELIVTGLDKPQGRSFVMTPPPVKVWAEEKSIPVWQPEYLNSSASESPISDKEWDLFVVFAYGKILPTWLINTPKYKTINLHPSLLPKLRGPNPIRATILNNDRETGVTIILLDEKMDHGPILAQKKVLISEEDWPPYGPALDDILVNAGASLLAETIPAWCEGEIKPIPQNHDRATFCEKMNRSSGQLDLNPLALPSGEKAFESLTLIRACDGWPGTFFVHEGRRVKVLDAEIDNNDALVIKTVTPAGAKTMPYSEYLKSIKQSKKT